MDNISNGNQFDLEDNERARKTHFHMEGSVPRLVLERLIEIVFYLYSCISQLVLITTTTTKTTELGSYNHFVVLHSILGDLHLFWG